MKRILLTITFAVFTLLPAATAETINVSDHGIVPGQDVTYAVNQLLESVRDKPDVTLVFPRGQYDFHPQNAFETYRAVANHDNGLKRMGFPLLNNTQRLGEGHYQL